jgi:hypothetical protein
MVGSDAFALARAAAAIEGAGLRIAAMARVADARERLARQAAAVWLELDSEVDRAAAALLDDINR